MGAEAAKVTARSISSAPGEQLLLAFCGSPRVHRGAETTQHIPWQSALCRKEQSAGMWQRKPQWWQGSSRVRLLMALWCQCSVQHPSSPEPQQGGTGHKLLSIYNG